MAHEWRHILMAKRAGRGHEPSGIAGTEHGGLAVECPSCADDEKEPLVEAELRKISPYLADANSYARDSSNVHQNIIDDVCRLLAIARIMMDCNFRAKNRANRSTAETSPYFGSGMAYMVPEADYEEFTKTSAFQDEVRASV